jgi:arabinogalactan endo-1,4-beta-galactosidase
MRRRNKILVVFWAMLFLISVFISCGSPKNYDWRPNSLATNVSSDTLYVQKVENLSDDFIMGMDASCVPALEASGVQYYDYDGQEKDVYEILAQNGINYIRVRIWNDPWVNSTRRRWTTCATPTQLRCWQ